MVDFVMIYLVFCLFCIKIRNKENKEFTLKVKVKQVFLEIFLVDKFDKINKFNK